MKLCFITPLLCFLTTICFGQNVAVDSLSLVASRHKIDSIQAAFYHHTDSLQSSYRRKLHAMNSSLRGWQSKLDSLTSRSFSQQTLTPHAIDSVQHRWSSRIDSLSSMARVSRTITQKLDSINHLRDSTWSEWNSKLETLKEKTVERLKGADLPPQLSSKVSEATGNIQNFRVPASNLNITQPGMNVDMPGLNNLNLQTPTGDLNVPPIGPLSDIHAGGDVTSQAGRYSNDIQAVTKGNLTDMNALPEAAESKAEELSRMNEVADQTKALDEYKDMTGNLQNPDSLKSFAVQEAKQVAVNHFAGKEQQLKEAMETLAKYKTKYSSLNSIADAMKRPPNEMKGKPFRERLVPGIGMQIQKKAGDVLVDFNAYAGYRFTGRFTAGLGWNQRLAYNFDQGLFNSRARVFGPRIFSEFKLWKGFSPRAELEVMNTNVPPLTRTPTSDPLRREWVPGAFVGVKKEYRFIKNVKGTALVMMRLFNPDHKSPYADVVNVRFGFEFPQKSKVKR